jgi:rod shape-determining protein MreD
MKLLAFANIKVYLTLILVNLCWFVLPIKNTISLVPDITIMLIFFFSILEETRPNLIFLIIFGLFLDFIFTPIVGHTALSYVLISLIASSNKKALKAQRFNIVWATFTVSLAVVMFIKFIILSYFGYVLELRGMLLIYLLDISSYPLLHFFLAKRLSWFRL